MWYYQLSDREKKRRASKRKSKNYTINKIKKEITDKNNDGKHTAPNSYIFQFGVGDRNGYKLTVSVTAI
jgi:hypothetical protein